MAFTPVTNGLQATIVWQQTGHRPNVNTLWFQDLTGDESLARCEQLAGLLEFWVAGEVVPLVGTHKTCVRIEVRDFTDPAGWKYVENVNQPGERAGGGAPNNVTLSITFRTGKVGKAFRGRNYLVGLVETDFAGDNFSSVQASAWSDAYYAMAAAVQPEDYIHVVTSFEEAGVPRPMGVMTAVTGYGFADLVVDTQRRRSRPFSG